MSLQTPVAIIGFNRPDLIEVLYERLSQVQPRRLLLISDGPRQDRPTERDLVRQTRELMTSPPWACEIKTNFSDTNLGCRTRLATGLEWAFLQTERLIILEDDCIPDPTFFPYCEELLERYEADPRVGLISGCRLVPQDPRQPESYLFSKYPFIWGWASWSRKWKGYDVNLSSWPSTRQTDWLHTKLNGRGRLVKHWQGSFDSIREGFNTWDHQLAYHLMRSNMVCTIPAVNLVENIGFRPDATHTVSKGSQRIPEVQPLRLPLSHPNEVAVHPSLDLQLEDQVVAPTLAHRIRRKLRARLEF